MISQVSWKVNRGTRGCVPLDKFTVIIGSPDSGKEQILSNLFHDHSAHWGLGVIEWWPDVLPPLTASGANAVVQEVRAFYPLVEDIRFLDGNRLQSVTFKGNGPVSVLHLDIGVRKIVEYAMLVVGMLDSITLLIENVDEHIECRYHKGLAQLVSRIPGQVVLTTTSPFFLDAVPVESIRVVAANGLRTCAALMTQHPKWKPSCTPGEFWATEGDGWPVRILSGGVLGEQK